jgi:hypothetical protein
MIYVILGLEMAAAASLPLHWFLGATLGLSYWIHRLDDG